MQLPIPEGLRLLTSVALLAVASAALALPLATAATPPSALTGPVSAVTGTTATLSGTVNPNGTTTSWNFEFGPTTSYGAPGSPTPAQSAGAGSTQSSVSTTIDGLSPGTSYHYRLDASSSAGTTQGGDGVFTTAALPVALSSPATGLGPSSATLNGTVDPNGQATSYFFEYGTTTSYGTVTPTGSAGSGGAPVAVSAALSGLQAGQSYHFRLVAESSTGTVTGADTSFRLSSPPTVTTSPASSVGPTGAKLSGSVNPNGQQTSWYFEYGTTTSYSSRTATQSAGAGSQPLGVSASLSGLAAATVYHFRLVATNPSGTSDGSDQSFGSAPAPVVQTGSAQGAGANSVTLTGSVNPEGNATSWSFQYGTTSAYGTSTASQSAGSGTVAKSVSAAIAKLSPATTYHYRIVASSKAGTSYGADVTFTTPAAVTLVAESSVSVYGRPLTLSGTVAGAASGVKVTVLTEPLGQPSFATLATVVSGSGGAWSYQARPSIETSYQASATGGESSPVTIGVRPAITLRLITGARFLVRVVGPTSFAGRVVQFQRLKPGGGWATLARRPLGGRSSVILPARLLPRGSSTIRLAMSVNEAGRGYLAGFSRTLVFVRA